MKIIKRRKFKNSIDQTRSFIRSFPGARNHGTALRNTTYTWFKIHIDSNNINFRILKTWKEKQTAEEIITIGKTCAYHNSEIFTLSIVVKVNIKLTAFIAKINN